MFRGRALSDILFKLSETLVVDKTPPMFALTEIKLCFQPVLCLRKSVKKMAFKNKNSSSKTTSKITFKNNCSLTYTRRP